jgi:hypothetical protein
MNNDENQRKSICIELRVCKSCSMNIHAQISLALHRCFYFQFAPFRTLFN